MPRELDLKLLSNSKPNPALSGGHPLVAAATYTATAISPSVAPVTIQIEDVVVISIVTGHGSSRRVLKKHFEGNYGVAYEISKSMMEEKTGHKRSLQVHYEPMSKDDDAHSGPSPSSYIPGPSNP